MNPSVAHRDIGRPLDGPLMTFDLPPILAEIKSEEDWRTQKRNAITLHKEGGLRVVLVAMHAGTSIQSHKAEAPFSLVVVEGRLVFRAAGREVALQRGQMLTLHGGVPHELEAPEEAAFLLTLATGAR